MPAVTGALKVKKNRDRAGQGMPWLAGGRSKDRQTREVRIVDSSNDGVAADARVSAMQEEKARLLALAFTC